MSERERNDKPERRDSRNKRRMKRKVCAFCSDKGFTGIDYKEYSKLKRFISERAKILPRRVTGTCARHQRDVTTAIKRARYLAFLPYTSD